MPVRTDPVHGIRDLRSARLARGLSQLRVARALGVSAQLVSRWERGVGAPGIVRVAEWGGAVGLDVSVRSFAGGVALRDAGQLRVLGRARSVIGGDWAWRTEVAVSANPLDRRAVDAVISRGGVRIGLEVITHLTDAQAQLRAVTLKQEAARFDAMVLVLANTRHNRSALVDAAPSLAPIFPLRGRAVLAALRAGRAPAADGLVLV